MNNQRWIIGGRAGARAALTMLVLAAGCVSTPERRIAKNPEAFAAFPAEAQARIRRGEVDIGFTPDMVRLALGEPSRVLTRRTAAGTVDIWLYTAYRYGTPLWPTPMMHTYRGRDGKLYRAYDTSFMAMDTREEYVALRLEFENGVVRAIERLR